MELAGQHGAGGGAMLKSTEHSNQPGLLQTFRCGFSATTLL